MKYADGEMSVDGRPPTSIRANDEWIGEDEIIVMPKNKSPISGESAGRKGSSIDIEFSKPLVRGVSVLLLISLILLMLVALVYSGQ